jgi:cyclopropane fatty-acyl-phospholipid synthase-like methyltransferase
VSNPATYSQIIGPADYNRLIAQHLYIGQADKAIARLVIYHSNEGNPIEVVELGCGPARILPLLAQIKGINLTGVDHDQAFFDYAQQVIRDQQVSATVVFDDVMTYRHPKPIDVAVSQGFHHHVVKGEPTRQYLRNVHSQLTQGGVYIVGDEYLPHYANDHERLVRAVIWYSHIINAALRNFHQQLAVEEAKTLIDDLAEGTQEGVVKSKEQIQFVLNEVDAIDETARLTQRLQAESLAERFLGELTSMRTSTETHNPSMDLSRGDFKICHRVFAEEVTAAGFTITGVTTFGPIETIGGMAVYVLRKT